MNIEFAQTNPLSTFQAYIIPFIKWGLIIYFAICIFLIIERKNNKSDDIKSRMWKKFQFSNYELLNQLDTAEKKQLLKTFDNTLLNATLFKGVKHSNFEKNGLSSKKSIRKRVSFSPHNEEYRI